MTPLEHQLAEALGRFLLFFKSGNDTPVERAVIYSDCETVNRAREALAEYDRQSQETNVT